MDRAEEAQRVVRHFFLDPRPIRLQHLAGVGQREDRLDAAGDVVRDQRDSAGRCDGGEQRIADAMLGDQGSHVRVQPADGLAGEVGIPVEQRERTLLPRQMGRREIGCAADLPGPVPCPLRGFHGAVAQAGHHQRVGQAGHPQPDPSLGDCLLTLRLEREARGVDGVVHHADCNRHQIGKLRFVQMGLRGKRRAH